MDIQVCGGLVLQSPRCSSPRCSVGTCVHRFVQPSPLFNSIPPEKKPCTCYRSLPCSSPLSLWQPLNLLPVSLDLPVPTAHVNGAVQHVTFCMASFTEHKVFRVHPCCISSTVSAALLFMAECCSVLVCGGAAFVYPFLLLNVVTVLLE